MKYLLLALTIFIGCSRENICTTTVCDPTSTPTPKVFGIKFEGSSNAPTRIFYSFGPNILVDHKDVILPYVLDVSAYVGQSYRVGYAGGTIELLYNGTETTLVANAYPANATGVLP